MNTPKKLNKYTIIIHRTAPLISHKYENDINYYVNYYRFLSGKQSTLTPLLEVFLLNRTSSLI
jgi:hypothetical protein